MWWGKIWNEIFTAPEDRDQDQRQWLQIITLGGIKSFGKAGLKTGLELQNDLGNNLQCVQGYIKDQTARTGTEYGKCPVLLYQVPTAPKIQCVLNPNCKYSTKQL